LAIGIEWASRCLTLGLYFVLPILVGLAVDRRWGLQPWGTVVGLLLGFGVGLFQLIRLTQRPDGSSGSDS
jgi:F0F1-type ATP synthase assembly protein I